MRNFKTLAITVYKILHASKGVTNELGFCDFDFVQVLVAKLVYMASHRNPFFSVRTEKIRGAREIE